MTTSGPYAGPLVEAGAVQVVRILDSLDRAIGDLVGNVAEVGLRTAVATGPPDA